MKQEEEWKNEIRKKDLQASQSGNICRYAVDSGYVKLHTSSFRSHFFYSVMVSG